MSDHDQNHCLACGARIDADGKAVEQRKRSTPDGRRAYYRKYMRARRAKEREQRRIENANSSATA
jgi:hypothetical protein